MAIIFDGPVTPTDATVLIRTVPQPADLLLNEILPDRTIGAMEVDFSVVTRIGNTARFRAEDAPAHITPRDSLVLNRAPLVPLSGAKPVIGELEARRLYGLHNGGSPVAPLADAIYNDLENLTLDVYRRAEQARGQALGTGTFALNEGGLNGTIDYGIPTANKPTAPTLFSQTGAGGTTPADIVGYLNTLRTQYIQTNGYPPGRMWTSTSVLNFMQQNKQLQSMAVQTIGSSFQGFAGLVPTNALNAILGTFNLPGVSRVYDSRISTDGSVAGQLILPNNVILLLPPENIEVGYTAWGPTVTAQEMAQLPGVFTEDLGPEGLVGFIDQGDAFPYKKQCFVDSLMLPVITNANAIMIVTVA